MDLIEVYSSHLNSDQTNSPISEQDIHPISEQDIHPISEQDIPPISEQNKPPLDTSNLAQLPLTHLDDLHLASDNTFAHSSLISKFDQDFPSDSKHKDGPITDIIAKKALNIPISKVSKKESETSNQVAVDFFHPSSNQKLSHSFRTFAQNSLLNDKKNTVNNNSYSVSLNASSSYNKNKRKQKKRPNNLEEKYLFPGSSESISNSDNPNNNNISNRSQRKNHKPAIQKNEVTI
ncbi:hypothetical protein AYI69_g4544 [Smittium culicis]|uniref:Uncharacterized protein n=1 Tax=Smittium culicis TaxID=133412 RepID=A0A1R1YCR5_9FUNG|nr:hypothetical protein AYI69_g4544 [Smittium culicis]